MALKTIYNVSIETFIYLDESSIVIVVSIKELSGVNWADPLLHGY